MCSSKNEPPVHLKQNQGRWTSHRGFYQSSKDAGYLGFPCYLPGMGQLDAFQIDDLSQDS